MTTYGRELNRARRDGFSPKDAMIEAQIACGDIYGYRRPHAAPGVYFIRCDLDTIKIGESNDPYGRMAKFRTGNPYGLELLHTIEERDDRARSMLEKSLHRRFRHLNVRDEWFHRGPELEVYIDSICGLDCY